MIEYILIGYGIGFLFTFMFVKWQRYEGKTFNIKNKAFTATIWPFYFIRKFLR